MKALLTIIILTFIQMVSFSQKAAIPISGTYVIPSPGEQLLIELKSANLDFPYKRNELIEVFGPNDVLIGSGTVELCAFDQCIDTGNVGGVEFNPTITGGAIGLGTASFPESPLGMTLKQELDPGTYVIVVRDRDTKEVIHRRTLTLVHPEPLIKDFTVHYPDVSTTTNNILIDPNKDLNEVRFVFDGENLNHPFKSVSIQGLKLKKVPNQPNTFVTDGWTAQKLKSISLEDPQVTIERYFVSQSYATDVRIEAQPPVITGNLVRKINAGQNRYVLTLNVSHLFKRARVQIEEVGGGNILVNEGTFDGAKVDIENGTISQEILFREGALRSGNGRFMVKIINRDGLESAPAIIQMQVREASITATPASAGRPFIEGIRTRVRFARSDNAAAFRFNEEVRLIVDGKQQVITPRNLDGSLNQFSADVFFPNGVNGYVPFELVAGRNSWRGYFQEIIDQPKLVEEPREVHVGSSVLLHLEDPNDKVKAIVRSDFDGIKLTDPDFSDGTTEVSVDKDVPVNTSFTVGIYYERHELQTIDFNVKSWPNPKRVAEFRVGAKKYAVDPNQSITIGQNEIIRLQTKKEGLKKTTSQLTAQLVKSDGTKLGTPQPLVYDEKSQRAGTSLTPYGFGIKGGDEFMIELVNPLSQPIIQRAYAKRSFRERILANAGVSAVNVYFKERRDENNEKLPATTLISGVNLGVYYMVETLQGSGKRPFGYGINLMAQEDDSEVELRMGTSVLLYETISFGFNFPMGSGDAGSAFFIGANVSFLDLSKIFDSGNK